MMSCIITSSVLILAVILIRSMFKKQLSRRLCYALWLIVAARLLLPFPMFESTASIMNLYPNMHSKAETSKPIADHEIGGDNFVQNSVTVDSEQNITTTDVEDVTAIEINPDSRISDQSDSPNEIFLAAFNINTLLKIIWIAGMILTALFFLVQNYMFYRYLKKNRVRMADAECRLPVYVVASLYSPCLYGFFQPSIYLSATNTEDETWKHFILLHEELHYQHKDHIWALIRSLCLIIHWFNPLVWLAAILSRQDCELACDEGVIKNIGDEQRILYGDMLLSMVAVNDLPEEDNDTGIQITVTAKKEKNQYIANCPYLNKQVLFQRNTDSGNDEIPAREGEEVGGNVRGFVNMKVTEENGEKVLTLLEYLHGENSINDGIADAVFTIRFDEKDEAYIADFSIDPYPPNSN